MGARKEMADEKADPEIVILLQVSTNRYLKKLPDMVHSKRQKQQILHMIHSSLWGSHVFREGHKPRRIPLWCTSMEHKIRADKAVTGV
jgi:hypothetical protein